MSALTIAPLGAVTAPNYWSTLASLPLSYTSSSDGERTDVVSIDGQNRWAATAAAAISDGVRAVLVSRPGPVPSDHVRELVELAERNSVMIEFSEDYAGDPIFERHGVELAAHLQSLSALIISQIAPEISRAQAIFSILRTIRALGLPADITSVADRPTSVTVNGTAGNLTFAASLTRGSVGVGQRVQVLGYAKNLDIRLYGSSSARPAIALVTSMAGENKLSTVYETAERASWRRVAAKYSAPAGHTTALRELLSDLEALEQL